MTTFPRRARNFGANVVTPVRSAGCFRYAENAILETQEGHGGVGVIGLGKTFIDQDRSPRLNLLDFAHQKARQIKIVHGHVQKQTAAGLQQKFRLGG